MGGSFAGLNTALSALHAQRRGLDVAGQNVANANTEGYSRQRVNLQAVGGPPVPAVYSVSDGIGTGVSVTDVARVRDALLESRGRAEHAQSGYTNVAAQAYLMVENAFGEPSDTGLQAQLGDFFNGWYEVANLPGDMAARNLVIRRGGGVADTLRQTYASLESQWTSMRSQIGAHVTAVNSAATAVGQLNQAIVRAKAADLPVNELIDQRDLHLMEISKLTGASVSERTDGAVDVLLGGSSLVNGPHVRALRAAGTDQLSNASGPERVRLEWINPEAPSGPGVPAMIVGGTIAGALEAMGDVIPAYAEGLNNVAARLIDHVNAQHRLGYGLDDVNDRPFFTGDSASTIQLAITDPEDLGVASAAGVLDGVNADALARAGRDTATEQGAESMYQEFVVGLGVAAQSVNRRAEIQARTVTDIDALRAGDSGVNLDEEMTNLVMFQRAYEAASRVLTTVDAMLDTLINRTGLVGR